MKNDALQSKSGRFLRLAGMFLLAVLALTVFAGPVYATDLPDSSPTLDGIQIYRNVLEDDDMFIFIKEDTPYASPPTTDYDEAFIWQLYDTTDTIELARAVGYAYNDYGYNENIIGFYFAADDAPAWGGAYYLKLTGTPIAFSTPPVYQFPIESGDYSSLTDQDDVQIAISNQVIEWAEDLNSEWGLDPDDYLTASGQTTQSLSLEGETFFRGAVYGIQSLAPYAFQLVTLNVTNTERTWTDNYTTNLLTMYDGTYLDTAMDDANTGLGADYNLAGIIGLIVMMGILVGACVYVGGDIWGSMVIASGPLVIGGRLAMIGLGELGFVAAMMWLFISGKIWKVF